MAEVQLAWRIYYGDGSIFQSSGGGPEKAPGFGVIVIVQPDPEVGRVLMHGWDWYYYVPDENQWWGSDIHGLLARLINRLPTEAVCQGMNVSNSIFRHIMACAKHDADFPAKSGRRRGECP